MAIFMDKNAEKRAEQVVREGGVLAILYFDLHGPKPEVLQQLGTGFVQKILVEPGIVYAEGRIDEPIENKGVFSTSVEVKIIAKDYPSMVRLCGLYTPFSIEIIKPDKIVLTMDLAHDVLMNISTAAQEYKKYIIEKVSKPEDLVRYKQQIQNKINLGKKLLEKKESVI